MFYILYDLCHMVLINIQLKSNQNIFCPPVTQGLKFKTDNIKY